MGATDQGSAEQEDTSMMDMQQILGQARVVVIDDFIANLRLLERVLRQMGIEHVDVFLDPQQGLDHLLSQTWDVLLLDLDMPVLDGFAILGRLKELDRVPPVIVVSALTDIASRHRGLGEGASDYIGKPFDLVELQLKVKNALKLSMANRQLEAQRQTLSHTIDCQTDELGQSYQAVIRALTRTLEFRDTDTGQHVERVGTSAAMLAERLGQSRDYVEHIRLAAMMHDVGKVGIPDQILLKKERLDPGEHEVMKTHAEIGFRILCEAGDTPLVRMASEIALAHHENWDGSGYPRGLRGEAIPLSARITSVSDVYDSLRCGRPYKHCWTAEAARDYLIEQRGRMFQSEIVDAFLTLQADVEAMRTQWLSKHSTIDHETEVDWRSPAA